MEPSKLTAYASGKDSTRSGSQGCAIVLPPRLSAGGDSYEDTALPVAADSAPPPEAAVPERLRELRRLFGRGFETLEERAESFHRQAAFMRDYEDDVPWSGDFLRYFPTYEDLPVRQLRGYFTWRAQVRKGVFRPIPLSAAYLYPYELLNGIGADSPEDVLRRLLDFEAGYLDAGFGNERMRQNLRRWMLEYAVLHDLPPETARRVADPEMLGRDAAYSALRSPGTHSDEEVFSAFLAMGGGKTAESPVVAADSEGGRHLFCEVWRAASSFRQEGRDLFTLCFGERKTRLWHPFCNVLCHERPEAADREYVLDDCRRYRCRNGVWRMTAYERLSFDRARFLGFLHEVDARLRRLRKTGRPLRSHPAHAWVVPFVDAAVEADEKARLEASRPRITIDWSGLDRIRRDAMSTRDSLLTEEELRESKEAEQAAEAGTGREREAPPLDPVLARILRTLLRGGDAADILRSEHRMPSLVADAVNEALFDEFGDTVVVCEGDALSLVEDYAEDVRRLLGETNHG